MSDLPEVKYFAAEFDRLIGEADPDVWAYQGERHLAAVLHSQVQQFFMGLEAALSPKITDRMSRGRLLQLGLSVAHELRLEPDEGDPDLFDQFAYMQALIDAVPFDAAYGAGFAPDGSISILVGPNLPSFTEIGIGGSQEHDSRDLLSAIAIASSCTSIAAKLGARLKCDRPEPVSGATDSGREPIVGGGQDRVRIGGSNGVDQPESDRWLQELEVAATPHFNIWSMGSEQAWVEHAITLLGLAGLLSETHEVERALSAARVMALWALHVEFAAHTDEGAPGDWLESAGAWVNEGISTDQIRLLNQELGLGWPIDDDEYEVSLREVCVDIIRHVRQEVVDVLQTELGESWTFAYLWAARHDDVSYPLHDDLLREILNGDPDSKTQGFYWVQSGMSL